MSAISVYLNVGQPIAGTDSVDEILAIDSANLTIKGYAGNDVLLSIGSGNNTITGNAGDDLIVNFSTGDNTIQGGSGADTIVNVGTGDNTIEGGDGADIIMSAGTGDNLLKGGAGGDTIVNLGTAAELQGGHGADTLIGWDGDDTIVGGHGQDVLTGGGGDDVLTGGGGADTFKTSVELSANLNNLNFGLNVASGEDTITDFDGNQGDVLQIDLDLETTSEAITLVGSKLHFDGLISQVVDLRSALSFDSSTGKLKINGKLLVTLENPANFDIHTDVEFI